MVKFDGNVPLAFALTLAAGLSTCLGGLVTFHKRLVSLARPSSIAVALGLSAGVMIFISLVEIFSESVDDFEKFFASSDKRTFNTTCDDSATPTRCKGHSRLLATSCFFAGAAMIFVLDFLVHKISPASEHTLEVEEMNAFDVVQVDTEQRQSRQREATQRSLNRTGILTAVAIAIHNLPEGVTTFMGAMKSPKLGVVLAISIALHNIPEGIAVATPVYFATGSRYKGLFYTFISALAEPLGGILCWLIIADGLNPMLNGMMFGLVAGMMVTISIKELIPTALKFYPSKGPMTLSILIGMLIMAVSLILFDYAGV